MYILEVVECVCLLRAKQGLCQRCCFFYFGVIAFLVSARASPVGVAACTRQNLCAKNCIMVGIAIVAERITIRDYIKNACHGAQGGSYV